MVFGSSRRRKSSGSTPSLEPLAPDNPEIETLRLTLNEMRRSSRTSRTSAQQNYADNMIRLLENVLSNLEQNRNSGGPNQYQLSRENVSQLWTTISSLNLAVAQTGPDMVRNENTTVRVVAMDTSGGTSTQARRERDEYNTVDEEIPPYNVTLHKYLDRISFDPRFAPCLRINRRLVRSENDLSESIDDLKAFNLLPTKIDPWAISHIDDLEFEDMIPSLIREVGADDDELDIEEQGEGFAASPPGITTHEGDYISSSDTLDRVLARSLLESEFYRTVPSNPPMYNKLR